MVDLWEKSHLPIAAEPGDWRCIVAGQTLGPFTFQRLVDKMVDGSVDEATPVSRDSSPFLPVREVAALAPHIAAARRARSLRLRRRRRRRQAGIVVLAVATLALAAFFTHAALEARRQQQRAEVGVQRALLQAQAERQAAQVAAAAAAATAEVPMDLAPIVTLESPQDVHLPPSPPPRRRRTAAPLVQSCGLTQQMVYATLRQGLGRINRCVVQAKRAAAGTALPRRLELSFVVQASGRVVEFAVEDRLLRRGALHDCLAQAFGQLHFPATRGASCPVTLPLKIAD